jgi:hypothetical protein
VYEVFGYYVHNELLCDCYAEISDLFRKDNKEIIKYAYIADFIFTLIFVFIYSAFIKKHTITTGILYGSLIGLVLTCGMVNQYIVYPITKHLLVLWIIFTMFQMALCGLSLGVIYRPRKGFKKIKLIKRKKPVPVGEPVYEEHIEFMDEENSEIDNNPKSENQEEIKKDITYESDAP